MNKSSGFATDSFLLNNVSSVSKLFRPEIGAGEESNVLHASESWLRRTRSAKTTAKRSQRLDVDGQVSRCEALKIPISRWVPKSVGCRTAVQSRVVSWNFCVHDVEVNNKRSRSGGRGGMLGGEVDVDDEGNGEVFMAADIEADDKADVYVAVVVDADVEVVTPAASAAAGNSDRLVLFPNVVRDDDVRHVDVDRGDGEYDGKDDGNKLDEVMRRQIS